MHYSVVVKSSDFKVRKLWIHISASLLCGLSWGIMERVLTPLSLNFFIHNMEITISTSICFKKLH